jgi:hypothetical protein
MGPGVWRLGVDYERRRAQQPPDLLGERLRAEAPSARPPGYDPVFRAWAA